MKTKEIKIGSLVVYKIFDPIMEGRLGIVIGEHVFSMVKVVWFPPIKQLGDARYHYHNVESLKVISEVNSE